MEMSVHRALIELKTLKKRILKDAMNLTVVGITKGDTEKVNGVTIKEFEAKIQSEFDSVMALISNYGKIKRAVIRINAGTSTAADTVKVNGQYYSVAELIEELNSTYGRDGHGDAAFKPTVLKMLVKKLNDANNMLRSAELTADDNIQRYLAVSAANNKLEPAEVDALTAIWHKKNDLKLVDPLKVEKKIEALRAEIDSFRVEADAALSEANAIRKIDVDLTTVA